MSVDLEDHFCDLPFSDWQNYESRIVTTTKVILDLFKKHKVQATFFTLGYVAEKHPELIEEINSLGHEIASHGYSHTNIQKMTKEDFESDLVKSLTILQKISGEKIFGFRAPWFSIKKNDFWVFNILKKHLRYDSSVYPVGPHYGFQDAPRHIYKISNNNNPMKNDPNGDFIEIPMATLQFPMIGNIPIAGGIYLRFLPLNLIKLGLKKLNKDGFSAMCYIHPQDLDPDRPHLTGTSWHNYWGLKNTYKKIESLLRNFNFSTAREVIEL